MKGVINKIKGFFKREKTTTKVEPSKPAAESAEKKTPETNAQGGTKEQGS